MIFCHFIFSSPFVVTCSALSNWDSCRKGNVQPYEKNECNASCAEIDIYGFYCCLYDPSSQAKQSG